MNCLFICVLLALAVTATAISPLSNMNLASMFGDKFKVHPERFPPAPVSMQKKEESSPVTKGKYYRSTSTELGATNNEYMQLVVFDNKDCTGDVYYGAAYLLNYCWLYGYGDPATKADPYYVHFSLKSNGTLALNVHNTTNCQGPSSFRMNDIVDTGCTAQGNVGVRGVEVMTPLWPQGQGGFSIKSHHNVKSCNVDQGFAYNFNTEVYYKLNTCLNTTTSTPSSYSVSACSTSANSYTINSYTNDACTGKPSTKTIKSNDNCGQGTFSGEGNGEWGYQSYGCFDQAMHNKCYQNFGIASPACDAQLTKHALKFTCSDPGYTGCESRIITDNKKKNSEVFACCV